MTTENPCNQIREQLLDHAYGLLEDAEAAAVEQHLADCEACRNERDRVAAHRDLLSDAARLENPELDLTPPRAIPLWRRGWVKGLAAAAVLIAVGVVGFRAHVRNDAMRRHPVLHYTASNQVDPDGTTEIAIGLVTLEGEPSRGMVRCALRDGAGDTVLTQDVVVGAGGRATFSVPAKFAGRGEPMTAMFEAVVDGDAVAHAQHVVHVGGELRARVGTDKPLYRPGETVRVRAVTLERLHLTPAGDVDMSIEIRDATDEVVASADLRATDGVAAWVGRLPDHARGGVYKLVLSQDEERFPEVEQPFQVRTYRAPRMLWTTDLDRDSYAPGGRGALDIEVARTEGGVPAGAKVDAALRVDGETVWQDRFSVPADGVLRIPFELPTDVEEGRASMALVLNDGGNVESHSKRIPLTLGRLNVEFFPESGDLVAGVPQRVYFRVSDPTGEPADLSADVVDGAGHVVAEATVDVRGMGRFDFTPATGESYTLRARRPRDVDLVADFPDVEAGGTVLTTAAESFEAGSPIRARVASTKGGSHVVSAHCRGTEIGRTTVELAPGRMTDVSISPTIDVGGVVRLTVTDADGLPRAERLVAREPPHRIDIETSTPFASYAPGDEVRMQVLARDEQGIPRRAVLGLSVIDRAAASLADDRDTASLPMHFLLGLEVDELEDVASFEGDPEAVDLLLGVQGWRRFAWIDAETFREEGGAAAAHIVPVVPETTSATVSVNEDDAARAVRRRVRRIDRGLGQGASLVALGGAFLGGLFLLVRGLWKRNGVSASVGALLSLVVVAIVIPNTLSSSRLLDTMVAPDAAVGSDAGAWGGRGGIESEEPPVPSLELYESKFGPVETTSDIPPLGDDALPSNVMSGRVLDEDLDDGEVPLTDPVVTAGNGRFRLKLRDAKGLGYLPFGYQQHLYVREFAFKRRTDHDGSRRDFAEVLYWNPLLVTDTHGRAEVKFDTSDSVTTFEVRAEAHDGRGALGATTSSFLNRVPFHLEPKLPAELSTGDVLSLPIAIANDTAAAMDVRVGVEIDSPLATVSGDRQQVVRVGSEQRGRAVFEIAAGAGRGAFDVAITGSGPRGLSDRSSRRVRIVPRGYPMALSVGGQVSDRSESNLLLPDRYEELEGSIRFYPSALSTLVAGIDGLLRQPTGCFEQTSSSNHPNVLVLQFLDENDFAAPSVARRAREFVESGYERLTGFEVEGGGFSLYGQAPADPALSAYGLMEFTDIAKVHEVDEELLARTRRWLLAQRNGEGGFASAQGTWRCGAEVFDAFTLWALVEAETGEDLTPEVELLVRRAAKTRDQYVIALAANTLLDLEHAEAAETLRRLANFQKEDGSLIGSTTSIMGSRGANLAVETTALAALAFLRKEQYASNAERAIQWLSTQRRPGGSFGATQATVLALRAVVEYAKITEKREELQTVTVRVNGLAVGEVKVPVRSLGVPELTGDLLGTLRPGLNHIELTVDGQGAIPWALELRYRTDLPPSSPNCALGITTTLPDDQVVEGENVTARVSLLNRTDESVPTPLARIGIPAGLEPVTAHLDRLVEEKTIAAYELRPREVTLYFEALAAEESREIPLELLAAVPGRFEGPASHAYLYYTDDEQVWVEPLRVTVSAR